MQIGAVLSNNRVRLGVGTGWNKIEYDALNERFDTRGRRQAEQVEVMRRLWADDAVTFTGEFHTIEGAGINPRPTSPIPIWFGVLGDALQESGEDQPVEGRDDEPVHAPEESTWAEAGGLHEARSCADGFHRPFEPRLARKAHLGVQHQQAVDVEVLDAPEVNGFTD